MVGRGAFCRSPIDKGRGGGSGEGPSLRMSTAINAVIGEINPGPKGGPVKSRSLEGSSGRGEPGWPAKQRRKWGAFADSPQIRSPPTRCLPRFDVGPHGRCTPAGLRQNCSWGDAERGGFLAGPWKRPGAGGLNGHAKSMVVRTGLSLFCLDLRTGPARSSFGLERTEGPAIWPGKARALVHPSCANHGRQRQLRRGTPGRELDQSDVIKSRGILTRAKRKAIRCRRATAGPAQRVGQRKPVFPENSSGNRVNGPGQIDGGGLPSAELLVVRSGRFSWVLSSGRVCPASRQKVSRPPPEIYGKPWAAHHPGWRGRGVEKSGPIFAAGRSPAVEKPVM